MCSADLLEDPRSVGFQAACAVKACALSFAVAFARLFRPDRAPVACKYLNLYPSKPFGPFQILVWRSRGRCARGI